MNIIFNCGNLTSWSPAAGFEVYYFLLVPKCDTKVSVGIFQVNIKSVYIPFAFVHYIVWLMLVDVFYMNSLFLSVFSSVSSPYMWVIAPAKPWCWIEIFGTLAERWIHVGLAAMPCYMCLLLYHAFLFNIFFCLFFGIHILSIWISQTLVCLCLTFF